MSKSEILAEITEGNRGVQIKRDKRGDMSLLVCLNGWQWTSLVVDPDLLQLLSRTLDNYIKETT